MDAAENSLLKVLLIEDNPDEAELLKEFLNNEVAQKVCVTCVPRLRAALESLTRSSFDAILLDLTLPDSSGMDSLTSLRKFSTDIPIVVLTGLDDKELALRCVKNGAQDYLVKGKPSRGSIYRTINYAVERCRADAAFKQVKLLEQREHFIAMLAHDLRSPINGADRLVSVMLGGLAGPLTEKQQQLLSMLGGTHKTLLLMINNVLEAYRLEAGGERFEIAPIDIHRLTVECIQDIEPIAMGKNIELRFASQFRKYVLADIIAMRRVITNLLSNALKFTDEGGFVEVSLEQDAGRAILRVTDNGVGIPLEKQSHIFERFYQTDAHNRATGLGLGLHLCKHLITAQRGAISCKSQPGIGSTFEVALDIAHSNSVRAGIVDDNELDRIALPRMLQCLSIENISPDNGRDALAAT